jgi:hypothetical protein
MNRYLAGLRLVEALNLGLVKLCHINDEGRRCIDEYIKAEYLRHYQIGILEVC